MEWSSPLAWRCICAEESVSPPPVEPKCRKQIAVEINAGSSKPERSQAACFLGEPCLLRDTCFVQQRNAYHRHNRLFAFRFTIHCFLGSGGAGQKIGVTATAINSFTSTVAVTVSGLPAGVRRQSIDVLACSRSGPADNFDGGSAAVAGSATVTLTGTSGTLSHAATVAVNVSASAADFSLSVSPTSATIVAGRRGPRSASSPRPSTLSAVQSMWQSRGSLPELLPIQRHSH